jgi:ankyrin repeat protein
MAIEGQRLIAASESGDEREVQELLDAGSFVSWADASGSTALHAAATHGSVAVVRLLLERRATLEAAERVTGTTPLCSAIQFGRDAVVAVLLEAGASTTCVDDDLIAFARARMSDAGGEDAGRYERTLDLLRAAEERPAAAVAPTATVRVVEADCDDTGETG